MGAEAPVAADADSGADRHSPSRLAWSDKRQHLEFMARLVERHHGEAAHWVGLDNRDLRDKWQTR